MNLELFIQHLAQTALPPALFNPYKPEYSDSIIRQANLRHYLHTMQVQKPTVLLLGEAPGYRGCRITGVPFSSRAQLAGQAGYRDVHEWPDILGEATATIVWQTLQAHEQRPLLWNVLPFHPYQPGQPRTNRTPTGRELEWGRPFLQQLLILFPDLKIVAVGKKADAALTRWASWLSRPHQTVRHPSHGGKAEFQIGMAQMLQPTVK